MRPEQLAETGGIAELGERLGHVYWIGGGSGAGKSTIARLLADRHGLRRYATDDAMSDHDGRLMPQDAPLLSKFKAMDMDERWVSRSPETMLESFHWFQGELFSVIVEDLLHLPARPGVIAEGFRLLPRLVKPLLGQAGHAVWLLPTPEFRRAAFASRGSLWKIANKTCDPEKALRNLLERDRMFTDLLAEETKRLELPAVEIDTTTTEEDLAGRVTKILGL
jgi:2-phosphoglycerate kinase